MDANLLSSLAGAVVSLAFAYVPGLKEWYDEQPAQKKALVMLAALVLVALVIYALACAKWFNVPLTCDQAGIEALVTAFVSALVANQGTYLLMVRPAQKDS